jgi:hypothetical protein
MIIHPFSTFVALFCSLATATIRSYDSAFGETIESDNFSKEKIPGIIENSLNFDSLKVKNKLVSFQIYEDPRDEPSPDDEPNYQFFKFLHPFWLKRPTRLDTFWRKVFDELVTGMPPGRTSAENKLANHRNFLSFCGILSEDCKRKICLGTMDTDVANIISNKFNIPFSFSLEETFLKLIYCFFATGAKDKYVPIVPKYIQVNLYESGALNENQTAGSDESVTSQHLPVQMTLRKFALRKRANQGDIWNNIEAKKVSNIQKDKEPLLQPSNKANDGPPIQPARREEGLPKMGINFLLN